MHEIYELKEKLMRELEEYGAKEMSAGSLEIIDKLAHAIKNLCKIIEAMEEEEGYSERGGSYAGGQGGQGGNMGGGGSSYRGGSYRGGQGGGNRYSREGRENRYSREGGSYARGRGRNARRDSMGRYSSEMGYSRTDELEDMVESIRDMMQELPSELQKDAQKFVQKLEQQM